MGNILRQRVVCAANRYGDLIVCGARHHDKIMNKQIAILKALGREMKPTKGYQGFIDQYGVFMSREEALIIAKESGQPFDQERNSGNGKVLYSEGIY